MRTAHTEGSWRGQPKTCVAGRCLDDRRRRNRVVEQASSPDLHPPVGGGPPAAAPRWHGTARSRPLRVPASGSGRIARQGCKRSTGTCGGAARAGPLSSAEARQGVRCRTFGGGATALGADQTAGTDEFRWLALWRPKQLTEEEAIAAGPAHAEPAYRTSLPKTQLPAAVGLRLARAAQQVAQSLVPSSPRLNTTPVTVIPTIVLLGRWHVETREHSCHKSDVCAREE